jgi:hypothetical protein
VLPVHILKGPLQRLAGGQILDRPDVHGPAVDHHGHAVAQPFDLGQRMRKSANVSLPDSTTLVRFVTSPSTFRAVMASWVLMPGARKRAVPSTTSMVLKRNGKSSSSRRFQFSSSPSCESFSDLPCTRLISGP